MAIFLILFNSKQAFTRHVSHFVLFYVISVMVVELGPAQPQESRAEWLVVAQSAAKLSHDHKHLSA